MPNDDQRPGIDWGKYQTLTIERRQDGILLITIAEPGGYPPAFLARHHTEVSWIWRDFGDDPGSRVAVITGRGDKFWTVERSDGVKEMLQNPGSYDSIVNLIREGLVNAHGIVTATSPSYPPSTGRPWGRVSRSACSPTSASPRRTRA
jgi:enoyl-CoA hydratase